MLLKKDFTLLITGSVDNDAAAERAANAGKAVIRHKLCYVPVYQDFSELKKIQVKLRNSVAAFGKKIAAVIDVSEWIGHENEEYFTITLKYLHDMRMRMRYVFTVSDATEKDVLPIFIKIRCFLNGTMEIDRTLTETKELSSYLVNQCICKETASLLAEMLMREETKNIKTIPIIDNMCHEMRSESTNGKVELADMKRFLDDNQSLINIVCRNLGEEYSERIHDMMLNIESKKTA